MYQTPDRPFEPKESGGAEAEAPRLFHFILSSLDQDGITELVLPVAKGFHLGGGSPKGNVIGKGLEQAVMAGIRRMDSGQDGVDHLEPTRGLEPLIGQTFTRPQETG
jgi:hypothetical protein